MRLSAECAWICSRPSHAQGASPTFRGCGTTLPRALQKRGSHSSDGTLELSGSFTASQGPRLATASKRKDGSETRSKSCTTTRRRVVRCAASSSLESCGAYCTSRQHTPMQVHRSFYFDSRKEWVQVIARERRCVCGCRIFFLFRNTKARYFWCWLRCGQESDALSKSKRVMGGMCKQYWASTVNRPSSVSKMPGTNSSSKPRCTHRGFSCALTVV